MPRYVAFLRAVNVGGRIVKMDRLRTLFGELGYANVETFIASGNVLFDSSSKSVAALEKKIEAHLFKALGYDVATLVRPLSELAAIVESHPFDSIEDQQTVLVGFLRDSPSKSVITKLKALETPTDIFHVGGAHLYWWCKGRLNESKVTNVKLERAMDGSPVTFRNVTTVRKLAAKAD